MKMKFQEFAFSLLMLVSSVQAAEAPPGPSAVAAVDAKTAPDVDSISADPRAKIIEELADPDAEVSNIALILDSSGSMGQILDKNRTKMWYMKKLMKKFVREQWKLENKIGVHIYGARKKHDCDDIQETIPFSDHSVGRLDKSLDLLTPVGMTPLHKSIEKTVEGMKDLKGPKRVVIVTDGEDTCGGDPCKTAERIKKSNLDITFFVVALGFNNKSSDKLKKLECLGDVHQANDGESFAGAMAAAGQKTTHKNPNLRVISPNQDAMTYLYKIDEKGIRHAVSAFLAGVPQVVAPGNYDVVVRINPNYKFENVVIPPLKKVTLKIEGEGDVLVNFFGSHVKVNILDKNNKVIDKFKSDKPHAVSSGKWKLRMYKDPFFDLIVPDFYVYPNGHHVYDLSGVGVIRVESPKLQAYYVYSQDNTLVGHSLTGFPVVLKTGVYQVHVDDQCDFEHVEIRDKREVLVLDCANSAAYKNSAH